MFVVKKFPPHSTVMVMRKTMIKLIYLKLKYLKNYSQIISLATLISEELRKLESTIQCYTIKYLHARADARLITRAVNFPDITLVARE